MTVEEARDELQRLFAETQHAKKVWQKAENVALTMREHATKRKREYYEKAAKLEEASKVLNKEHANQ